MNKYKSNYLPQLKKQGLYDPRFEHDACGVGMVANIKGIASHSIIKLGLENLCSLEHRGAIGADPETGDGAGILIQMPHEFFLDQIKGLNFNLPNKGSYAVGMIFLPQDIDSRTKIETIIENLVHENGLVTLGWRDVPVNPDSIGVLSRSVMPVIRQIFVAIDKSNPENSNLELKLYVTRRQIEKSIESSSLVGKEDFYVCTLSSNKIVYKGLITSSQVEHFYPDLNNSLMTSSFAMVHSRFSTNTLGTWKLAHPYRHVIHNGEINTMRGNINWMNARQSSFKSKELGESIKHLLPIIPNEIQSDTASFDNALELLLATGRSLPHSLMMMIPEAWGEHLVMDKDKKSFYEYHSSLMEPWDGPALMIGTDGNQVCGVLDRNGLRPCRYLITTDDLLVMSSEAGVINVPPEKVLIKERIRPGKMFLLDTSKGRLIDDDELKSTLSTQKPYTKWLDDNRISITDLPQPSNFNDHDLNGLLPLQRAFGYTQEDLRITLEPMARTAYEPTGSMGNDTPLAVLSNESSLLFNYFKQLFAQVSNPPLDAIREELITSLSATIGTEQNLFDETEDHCKQLRLPSPIISNQELAQISELNSDSLACQTISTLFKPNIGSLESTLEKIFEETTKAVNQGKTIIVLSDRGVDETHVPIPSLLAVSGVHHHLIRQGLRNKVGIVLESGEPREVSHFTALISYGAGAINPYLALDTIAKIVKDNSSDTDALTFEAAEKNYFKASEKGILKVMSKMGISTIQSYRGAQIYEALGLNQSFVEKYFTWTPSRIGGITIETVEADVLSRHQMAFSEQNITNSLDLTAGGLYQWRRDGEYHMWNPETIANLQHATKSNNWDSYEKFASSSNTLNRQLSTIRGLLEFKFQNDPLPIDEVEPASEIVKRFATGAVSLGSISREAHETMGIAMNRIHARSNTGEGGEDWNRYNPDANGDSRNSAIKQVASGRFGVTTNYLANAQDLQIKMAQGSKPGEGGQLPGHKVDEYIGWVRNSTPGVELISPPPHHDIYSIEDLAQLLHDLKNSNPEARIHVKLVSEAGVGTIAAGVSKGHGDVVLISGDSGGTGASPESSIKNAGLPWELGLAETQQVLVLNDLRSRIVVQTDGQLKTGRDVAVACLLGAEEFGFATAPLITMGCIMLRKCHLNTCSVGIATQDPELRAQFAGEPENLINYFFFIAEDLRQIMAKLGFRTINEMVGRVDRLDGAKVIDHWKAKNIDFSSLLHMPKVPDSVLRYCNQTQDHGLEKSLDVVLREKCKESIATKTPISLEMDINNGNRTVGTTLSYDISKKYGEEGLPDDTIKITFNGSTGQSFAAFLAKGVSLNVNGDANDYFCKGLSGGKVIIQPPANSSFIPEENILVGNVVLYGATGGKVFIRGIAGERFAVRNSGAETVVEGLGDHGCEYMTRGKVVVLGPTGRNFAAGMSGGEAFIFDENGIFPKMCNTGMVSLEPVIEDKDVESLYHLISEHYESTKSANAKRILDGWDELLKKFVKVMPNDYKRVLEERALAEKG